jgi:DNA polymerase-3 subunit beta
MFELNLNKTHAQDVLTGILSIARSASIRDTQNVLLTITDDRRLKLTATNLDILYDGYVDAEVEENRSGSISLNAKLLADIVSAYPLPQIYIREAEPRWIEIGDGSLTYRLAGADPDNFPGQSVGTPPPALTFSGDLLAAEFKRALTVKHSSDDKRPHVQGILCQLTADGARLASTDGSRLVIREIPAQLPAPPDFKPVSALIPKKSLADVLRILTGGDVRLGVAQYGLFFNTPAQEFCWLRPLEGSYPDFSRLLSPEGVSFYPIDPKTFGDMFGRAAVMTSGEYRGAILKLDLGSVAITVTNPECGEFMETYNLPIAAQQFEIALNPHYVIDALKNAADSELQVGFKSKGEAVSISENGAIRWLIMPMRI